MLLHRMSEINPSYYTELINVFGRVFYFRLVIQIFLIHVYISMPPILYYQTNI